MAIMPGAVYKPMPYQSSLPTRYGPDTVILHTNGGGSGSDGDLYGWFARAGNTICAHFQVSKTGVIYQYVDTRYQAYAQFSGNAFGISVETQDDGNPDTPWTAAQIATINRIIDWAGVPRRLAPAGGGGIGYHSEHVAWNLSGHNCPGSVRANQLKNVVIPGTPPVTKDWFDMATKADLQAAIKAEIPAIAQEVVSHLNLSGYGDQVKGLRAGLDIPSPEAIAAAVVAAVTSPAALDAIVDRANQRGYAGTVKGLGQGIAAEVVSALNNAGYAHKLFGMSQGLGTPAPPKVDPNPPTV